jgi:30S ribosomal protein 3
LNGKIFLMNLNKNKVFRFKVLWSKTSIGVAVNQQHKENLDSPLTSFYFWPREDGWKLLKAELDSKPWMAEKAKNDILNDYTHILTFWLKNLDESLSLQNLKKHPLNIRIDFLGVNNFN